MSEQANDSGGIGLTRSYQRRPEVEAEISTLPEASTPPFLAIVEQAQHPETFVFAIRQLQRAGYETHAKELAERLLERTHRRLMRIAASQFPTSQTDQDEAAQMAAWQMYQEVLNTSPKEEFWEVFFTRMLYLACSDAADKIRAQREHEQQFDRGVDDDGNLWSDEDCLADPQPVDFDANVVLSELLAPLEGDVRRAMYLHAKGYKAKSSRPNESSISSLLGITDRTVRTYLRNGEKTIRERRALADRPVEEEHLP